jgi:Amt family ammonium transporter
MLSVGLFADGTANYAGTQVKGLFFGDASQLGAQAIGAVVVILWAGGVSYAFFKLCDRLMGIRSTPEDELAGLDMPEMGAPAYWDDGEPLKGGVFPIPAPAFGGAAGD